MCQKGLVLGTVRRRHVDGSPVFKHRTSERLLFFASDGRWYAGGNTDDMNLWASRGQLRSRVCAAGTLPGDVEAWEVELSLYGYVRSRTCKVLSIPGCELQLCKDAIRAAPPAVHIAGAAVDNWNGKYLLQIHSSCPTRHKLFDGHEPRFLLEIPPHASRFSMERSF